jgi:predicted solute-binding protein
MKRFLGRIKDIKAQVMGKAVIEIEVDHQVAKKLEEMLNKSVQVKVKNDEEE